MEGEGVPRPMSATMPVSTVPDRPACPSNQAFVENDSNNAPFQDVASSCEPGTASTGHVARSSLYAPTLVSVNTAKRPREEPTSNEDDVKRARSAEPGPAVASFRRADKVDVSASRQPFKDTGTGGTASQGNLFGSTGRASADRGADTTGGVQSASKDPVPDDCPVVAPPDHSKGTDKGRKVGGAGAVEGGDRDAQLRLLPRLALQQVLRRLGLHDDFQFTDAAEHHLVGLAEAMLERTMDFGACMCAARQSNWLQAQDLELYLEREWNIHLPGYGDPNMRPTVLPSGTDEARRAAVRQAMADLRPEPIRPASGVNEGSVKFRDVDPSVENPVLRE